VVIAVIIAGDESTAHLSVTSSVTSSSTTHSLPFNALRYFTDSLPPVTFDLVLPPSDAPAHYASLPLPVVGLRDVMFPDVTAEQAEQPMTSPRLTGSRSFGDVIYPQQRVFTVERAAQRLKTPSKRRGLSSLSVY